MRPNFVIALSKVDYAILRGTYADPRGNVSLEEEAIDMDSYSMALAAHNSGGKVFVQVRDVLEAGTIEPRRVKLPGILVDGIVEHREQPQTYLGGYDLTISGQHRRLSSNDAIELVSHPVRRLIARRAARELVAGASNQLWLWYSRRYSWGCAARRRALSKFVAECRTGGA